MTSRADKLLDSVVRQYLESGDFNGLRVDETDRRQLTTIRSLVSQRRVDAVFEDQYPNPAIKAFEPASATEQEDKLSGSTVPRFCIYPTPEVLEKRTDRSAYAGVPFTLELALGAPQLEHRSFDLFVLEHYRNDPRYYYRCDDVHGMLAIADEFNERPEVPDKDNVLIQSFGFSYSPDMDRAVAVFVCYLGKLSPEHQQVWKARELPRGYHLHPDFVRSQLIGEFPTHIPIFAAFLMEMSLINEQSRRMGRRPLFRKCPSYEEPPRRFGFLVRPTSTEFNDFVLLLDKLLSDNIDKAFFGEEVPDEGDVQRKDGKVVVQKRGTLQMLNEWFRKCFTPEDWSPINEMIGGLKEIRRLRQTPAHNISSDEFDQTYFRRQRELMMTAYGAVRTIRLAFANHPACRKVETPIALYEGRIRTF